MKEDKSLLVRFAMSYGLNMGIYWLFKYLIFIFSLHWEILNMVYWGFTFLVPLIAYIFTLRYKQELGGRIGFWHAWQFGVLLYLFAGLIVSLLHYVFYRYIASPDLISNAYKEGLSLLKTMNISSEVQKMIEKMPVPTPIMMVFSQLLNNLFYGVVFSVPVALLASMKHAPGQQNDSNT